MRKTGRFTALILLVFAMAGCKKADNEKLAAVAKTVSGNVRAMLPGKAPLRVSAGGAADLETRVRDRLLNDRYLSESSLRVTAENATIRLSGEVSNADLKRRASELAESTVGVEAVIDEIQIAR
jgi:osmotically-inducible protein OsmY